MQVTSLEQYKDHKHDHDHHHHDGEGCSSCGHDHEHIPVKLSQTFIGLIFVINAFVFERLNAENESVAAFSAAIGAIVLGFPIIVTAWKDIRKGNLTVNELVAIAVLAAFASGDYKTAGIVSFFMLLGEVIESRTAEGARASIESLIKLTPTKARRLKSTGDEEEVAAAD